MKLAKNLLRELRESKSITQEELAQQMSVSRQTINAIERDRYTPSLPLAIKLSRFFDCQVTDLFDVQEDFQ